MPTLRVVNQLGRAPAAPISAGFGAEGATIGRSPDCVLVLPDPARHISREQARVAYSNGTYVITCLGSVNSAIVVNGAELSSGQSATLRGGDSIVVADYELCFDLAPAAPAAGAQRADAPAQAAASAIPDDFDPFAEPMAEPPSGRGGAPARGGSRGAISPGPSPAATAAESDDDPFSMPAANRPGLPDIHRDRRGQRQRECDGWWPSRADHRQRDERRHEERQRREDQRPVASSPLPAGELAGASVPCRVTGHAVSASPIPRTTS